MNKLFRKIMLCTSLGFTITAVSLSVQGCSSDSDDSLEAKPQKEEIYEYLECSEDDIFSKRGMEVLSEAFQRIGDKLVVESDTCYLTVDSAKDFNMSDYLFSMVKQSVGNANMQYKMYLLFKDNDKGIVIKNPFEINRSVVTTRVGVESMNGSQWSTTTYI